MTARPSLFPDFALVDVVDPDSGENNVTEPPAAYKSNGWLNGEAPPRNWFNWLHRLTSNWLHYLDEQRAATLSKIYRNRIGVAGTPSISDHGGGSYQPDWLYSPALGWVCTAAGGTLALVLDNVPPGAMVNACGVKWYNGDSGSRTPDLTLYQINGNFTGGAPSVTPIWTNAAAVGSHAWSNATGSAISPAVEAVNGDLFVLFVQSGVVDDAVCAFMLDCEE